jgi:hypothetical protein
LQWQSAREAALATRCKATVPPPAERRTLRRPLRWVAPQESAKASAWPLQCDRNADLCGVVRKVAVERCVMAPLWPPSDPPPSLDVTRGRWRWSDA